MSNSEKAKKTERLILIIIGTSLLVSGLTAYLVNRKISQIDRVNCQPVFNHETQSFQFVGPDC